MKKNKENIFAELDKEKKEIRLENFFEDGKPEKENFFDEFNNIKWRNRSLAIY